MTSPGLGIGVFPIAYATATFRTLTNSDFESGDNLNSLVQLMILAGPQGMIWEDGSPGFGYCRDLLSI